MKNSVNLTAPRQQLKAIALDFDGTLVKSNKIKDAAFETIFRRWPKYFKHMMQWHFEHNATDRTEKFRYFVCDILSAPTNIALIDELSQEFNLLTKDAIIACPYVPGALEFLEMAYRRYPLYLVSATPQVVLEEIIAERKLSTYFKDVYGAPIIKADMLRTIIKIESIQEDNLMLIGDSTSDQQAANSLRVNFIGIGSNRTVVDNGNVTFKNFFPLSHYIRDKYELPS